MHDVVAMEQLITQLRRENVEFKKQVADQQTVISGLRRDLSGASAKLSDMTGMQRSMFTVYLMFLFTSEAGTIDCC